MQIFSNDKTVESNTVPDLEDFNSEFLATQVRKKENI